MGAFAIDSILWQIRCTHYNPTIFGPIHDMPGWAVGRGMDQNKTAVHFPLSFLFGSSCACTFFQCFVCEQEKVRNESWKEEEGENIYFDAPTGRV